MEIFKIHGAAFQVTFGHFRRSTLIKGGLEVLYEVSAEMAKNTYNDVLLERCTILLNNLYLEHVNKEVLGCFLDLEATLHLSPRKLKMQGKIIREITRRITMH